MRADVGNDLVTAEELLAIEIPGKTLELIRGRLVVHEPPSVYHGRVSARLTVILGGFAYANRLGEVFGQDTGFKLASGPDLVRAPDLAFVSRERMSEVPREGYGPGAPDLAVEIVSPGDRRGALLAKVGDWLEGGSRLVWVIDGTRRQAQVYRPDGSVSLVDAAGSLDGEAVLPGFRCALTEILD